MMRADTNLFTVDECNFPEVRKYHSTYECRTPKSICQNLNLGFNLSFRRKWKMLLTGLAGLPIWSCGDGKLWYRRVNRGVRLFRHKIGRVRLVVFAIFVIAYLIAIINANTGETTAPVAEHMRILLFPEAEESIEEMISQQFTKSLMPFLPGFVASQSLMSIQSVCANYLERSNNFQCDIIKISLHGTENNPYKGVPCSDQNFLKSSIVNGDYEPYDEVPTALKKIYREQNTSDADQFKKDYVIGAGWQFFEPLFNTASDQKDGKLGPLPTLNLKLNELAKGLGVSKKSKLFSDDSTEFKQASALPRRPFKADSTSNISHLSVNRNHHWDVAFACEPDEVEVSFKITTIRSTVPLWWRFKLSWTATGEHLNFYRTRLHVKTGLSFTRENRINAIAPFVALFIFCTCYLLPAFISALLLPLTLFRLLTKRGTFKRNVELVADPLDCRILYTAWYKVFIENVGASLSIIGFLISAYYIFSVNSSTSYYSEKSLASVSPFTYWSNNLQMDSNQLLCQILLGFWSAGGVHSFALVIYLIRLLEVSSLFAGTNFIFTTLLFAFFPVLHFCILFLILLLSFAVILFAAYGKVYTQYCTLGRCFWNILLYSFSFGDQSNAEFLINPNIEDTAVSLQVVLLVFQILVVIVFLNMFTTIVIDAYGVAINRASSAAKMKRLKAAMWYRAKKHFGYHHELQEEVDILGGEPGAIFFRATVPDDENPLGVVKKDPDMTEVVKRLKTALEALQPMLPQLQEQQRIRVDSSDAIQPAKIDIHFSEGGDEDHSDRDEYTGRLRDSEAGVRRHVVRSRRPSLPSNLSSGANIIPDYGDVTGGGTGDERESLLRKQK